MIREPRSQRDMEGEPFVALVDVPEDREYNAWCRARALELAIARYPAALGDDLLEVADQYHAWIDEGRMP